jgi:hypothetical protein
MADRTILERKGAQRWWRVREVRGVDPCLLPASYCAGWLTFECEDGARRRLAPIPRGWDDLSETALQALLALARPATDAAELRTLEASEASP